MDLKMILVSRGPDPSNFPRNRFSQMGNFMVTIAVILVLMSLIFLPQYASADGGNRYFHIPINEETARSAAIVVVCGDSRILSAGQLSRAQCARKFENAFQSCWKDIGNLLPGLDLVDKDTGKPVVDLSSVAFKSLAEIATRCVQSRILLDEVGSVGGNSAASPDESAEKGAANAQTSSTQQVSVGEVLSAVAAQLEENRTGIRKLARKTRNVDFEIATLIDTETVSFVTVEAGALAEKKLTGSESDLPVLMAEAGVKTIAGGKQVRAFFSGTHFVGESTYFSVEYLFDEPESLPDCRLEFFEYACGACDHPNRVGEWKTRVRWLPAALHASKVPGAAEDTLKDLSNEVTECYLSGIETIMASPK